MSKTDLQNAPILLREDRPGGICVITLNRPAQRNSLSRALLQALEEMLAEIAADSTTRVVVPARCSAPGMICAKSPRIALMRMAGAAFTPMPWRPARG
jgi:hypothetical protein